jgi:hypothetical protein
MALLTQQQLAQALGVTDRAIRMWVDEGMPSVGEGRRKVHDEDACRAWCTRAGKAIAERRPVDAAPAGAVAPIRQAAEHMAGFGPLLVDTERAAVRPELEGQPHGGALLRHRRSGEASAVEHAADLAALRNAAASPIERARAALVAASCALADAIESEGGAAGRDFDSFRTIIDGLRMAESGWLDLQRERLELVEREVAQACMGALARRFVLALERLGVRAASQVELWLNDAEFKAMTSDDRARTVRAWVQTQTRQARLAESEAEAAQEIERMVRAAIAERRGA